MVGNDVVDLRDSDADPATLSARFDGRVFSPAELRSIEASAEPARQRWRLWAAKEAAYKLLRRLDPAIPFSPRRLIVSLEERVGRPLRGALQPRPRATSAGEPFPPQRVLALGEGRGSVRFEGRELELRVLDSDGAVHALAALPGDSPARLVHGLWRLDRRDSRRGDPHGPGEAVRELACRALTRLLGEPQDSAPLIEVRRENRIPSFWRGGVRLPVALSLSHHGGLVAFALGEGAAS
ncbi:MAG: 4-phosphopantetheinyl transferase family protein [Deltaproteobacteria bacterium]|nr:4-phosphopantetheinyl transferase family protein [Deltaproteobacteria bacterium]MBW2420094.1 4-phosphopantetheinyl transferase family protein [Deltaproteobacteria bacterium]